MGIKLENIRDGRIIELDREPQIDGFLNSSDLNPNGKQQDFGWRLSPETVAEIEEMRANAELMKNLSTKRGIPIDDITDGQLVSEILTRINAEKAVEEKARDFDANAEADYNARVRNALKGVGGDDEDDGGEGEIERLKAELKAAKAETKSVKQTAAKLRDEAKKSKRASEGEKEASPEVEKAKQDKAQAPEAPTDTK